jgi:3',5'-nucleoside bisphosphate phosphatase
MAYHESNRGLVNRRFALRAPRAEEMMKIDLHIHTRTGSDGRMSLAEVITEAKRRGLDFIAITDHDAAAHQREAVTLCQGQGMRCLTGVELNVTFPYQGKSYSLDFLGYGFNARNEALLDKLRSLGEHRQRRAREILDNLNRELVREAKAPLGPRDMQAISTAADGALGRPHIARYLVEQGLVAGTQEAFDRYLVHCDVPKYPLSLEEAATLVRGAGGRLVLAHPNDPHGTSLAKISPHLETQAAVITEYMLNYIDGIECWHSRASAATADYYAGFARARHLCLTGGSDCHQNPVIMGTVPVPEWVASQFVTE